MGSRTALEEQSGWLEHAAFMDGLVDDGFVVLGGPLAGELRVILVVDADVRGGGSCPARPRPVERHAPGHRVGRCLDDPPGWPEPLTQRAFCLLLAIQITSVSVFAQWQPFVDGVYTCSGGRSAVGFDSTLVRLETDEGIVGWGEMAPLGSFYDPSFAAGAREGLRILAPLVLGLDPRQHATLTTTVDHHLAGHPYAKSALDMAAWDVDRHRRRHAARRAAGRA